ncbi:MULTISPECIES: thiol peroxidase [unclassified Colwellia]|uniref:thiol peroxidase n=1 Tax=unclassified Colwellia TaxID=196834 RepID=UPI0015F5FCE1|nr:MULTISPECIES: thiol peroxidase [unclassified Colwellia]MBA6230981.1 thiol peroxidase [Colwellia sp. MB02u-7]MBA6234912.1 thiol peroxidase [Colwellia sp. MB02u-11]MBA6255776.1 thiol peroxidase [Colwellia sp. MB3u-28]MBA6261917.1 thiol peroxidase [Colwellia sp. MB3u-41]MBA6301467.1 thiol peroxidase [Colwellia sp. MB3u-22]
MKFSTIFVSLPLLLTLNNFTLFKASANSLHEDNLQQTTNLVKANNKFITLLGTQVDVGQKAPNFKVVNESFVPVTLHEFSGKNLLISIVPSLDTGICSLQTKRFNEEVANLPTDIVMLTISNDLPFAQKRFCETENIDKIRVLSDSVWRDFGTNYGLLIKDMGLLTRAIFIIDSSGIIAYKEIVADISKHPNYELALSTIIALSPIESSPQESSPTNIEKK